MNLVDTHELDCDVFVAGGGAAGAPCAIAAARCGAKVILCQDRPVLGGNASSEVRMHIVGADGTGKSRRGAALETEAREGGILEEIRLENCVRNPQRSASMFDLILYEKCRAEPNLTLLLNTVVTGVEMDGDRIERAIAERQSTEDRFLIRARIFVDCTGDGRLGAEAGAPFMEGREGRGQFGESLAPERADNCRLGSTILMQARRHEEAVSFVAPDWARRFNREDLKLRLYATPGEEEPSHEYGYWWVEWGGTLDTIKDNERIRDELLAVFLGVWDHVKNGPPGTPPGEDPFGASHWALDWFGFLPGKRESRRFVGRHILTEKDILASRPFRDAIAYGGWSLDLHPPAGIDAPEEAPCEQRAVPYLYDIPLGCCVSRDLRNLMFAGRNVSATHVAFSSTRVMGTCAAVGQGAGTAAACAVDAGVDPVEISLRRELVERIRRRLLRDDAFLIDGVNDDPCDLARLAKVTGGSESAGGEAVQVISGRNRSVHGHGGAPPGRAHQGTHRWMSDPADGFPVSLLLEWPEPIRAKEVQLVFDTGLHRPLTLSHHDGYTATMHWGKPQPETVRDYAVEVFDGREWRCVAEVEGNYLRRRVHAIPGAGLVTGLRITVRAANGLDHARICEVRVY